MNLRGDVKVGRRGLFYEQIAGVWEVGRAAMVNAMSEQEGLVHLTVWYPPLHKRGRDDVFRDVKCTTELPDKNTVAEMTSCQRFGVFLPDEQYPALDMGTTGYR